MRVRHVGFFSDLPHGIPSEPSVESLVASCPQQDEDRLVNYLRCGVLFIACPGVVRDVLSKSDSIIGCAHILTDGVWAWPEDLAHYVSRYHVRLPSAFAEHASLNQWTVPNGIRVEGLSLEA